MPPNLRQLLRSPYWQTLWGCVAAGLSGCKLSDIEPSLYLRSYLQGSPKQRITMETFGRLRGRWVELQPGWALGLLVSDLMTKYGVVV